VVVSGLPAAGKSTLATHLSRDLGLVCVNRDELATTVLGDLWRVLPPDEQVRVARAKDRLVTSVVDAVLDAGGGVVLDNNFNVTQQADAVRGLLATRSVRAVEVCLWGDPAVLRQRFIERAAPPLTPDLEPFFEQVLHRDRWTVLSPPRPIFEFDTTDLATIDAGYARLLSSIRMNLAEPTRSRE
jgi:predicted kinase